MPINLPICNGGLYIYQFSAFLNFFTDLLKCFNVWRQCIKLQWQSIARMRAETFGRMNLWEYSLKITKSKDKAKRVRAMFVIMCSNKI